MTVLAERTALHIPPLHFFEHDGITYAVDGDAPNWIAVEQRGAELLRAMGEAPPAFGALVARYAAQYQVEAGKAWLHVHDFLTALDRARMRTSSPTACVSSGCRSTTPATSPARTASCRQVPAARRDWRATTSRG